MELGLATFADLPAGISPHQRMRDLLEEAELADQPGLDVFAIGEHHRADFLVSSPAVVLAAIAAKTERIRLSSAVTVLSSDDPVRVFQDFAELDLISGGRAEIMAGRGSFTESFPLFGQDLEDYDELYAEKLVLLLKIRAGTHVTWSGRHRPSLDDAGVWPRPIQDPLTSGSLKVASQATGTLGSLAISASASLEIDVSSTTLTSAPARLVVSGAAALGGTLAVQAASGFAPAAGTVLHLLDYGPKSGQFASITGPANWTVNAGTTALTATT